MKKKLLWIGDAAVSTGFARCTHKTLEVARLEWDVTVLGINHNGDPHPYPYPIYPADRGGDIFGVRRTAWAVEQVKPDLIVIQQDPWNFPEYIKEIRAVDENVPIVGAVAVDGGNCRGAMMNGLTHAIFWTRYGLTEARKGLYGGPGSVIPLGVDRAIYRPLDRPATRKRLLEGAPQAMIDGFIFGNVNRNQPRKRLDLTIEYFAEFIAQTKAEDAFLYMHVAPTTDLGWDIRQLARYYGVGKKLIFNEPEVGHGIPEAAVCATYNTIDVMVTTTQGEGWGLPTLEAMACGTPSIVPDWAALGEWTEDAAYKVPCDRTIATPNYVNSIGGLANKDKFVQAMVDMYESKDLREILSGRGLDLVKKFDWFQIGSDFTAVLGEVYDAHLSKRGRTDSKPAHDGEEVTR